MFATKSILALGIAAALTACGGGGGDSAAVPTTAAAKTAEGFWTGPASTGYNVSLAVLENGETWGVYTSGSTIYGALNGKATTAGTTFSATGKDYNFLIGSATAGTYTGTFSEKTAINATSNTGSTVALTYKTDYDKPALLTNLAGSYSYTGRTGAYMLATSTLTISATGTFASNALGCATSGSLVPRSTGKNIFNYTATFVGTCALASGTTITGVAYLDTTVSPNKILALGLNSDKSDGMVVLGTKL